MTQLKSDYDACMQCVKELKEEFLEGQPIEFFGQSLVIRSYVLDHNAQGRFRHTFVLDNDSIINIDVYPNHVS